MAQLVSPVLAWLAALVTGASGTGRVVPAAALASDRFDAAMGDADYPAVNADRTVAVLYQGDAGGVTDSPYCGCVREAWSVEVRVGYRYDLDPASADADAGDAKTAQARTRAADDKGVIRRALLWPPNYATAANGVRVDQVIPGAHRVEDSGSGLLVSVIPCELRVSYDPATVWEMAPAIGAMP